jgi:glycosyltransferase involved in cell wall biosynthesis
MTFIKNNKKFLFVLPRYYSGIAGGAETLAGNLAKQLKDRGDQIEIFTTCAKDNRTWENFFATGTSIEAGVKVTRFRVDERNLESWIPKQISISKGIKIGIDAELEWLSQGVNSITLYQETQKRKNEFDLIFFAPYLFATTFWGSLIAEDKAVLIPCLHDESYAYLDSIRCMFSAIKGVLFNALPEKHLAESIYGKLIGDEVGMGFDDFSEDYKDSLTPYFKDNFPYILYMGRKETGKQVHLLIDNFLLAKDAELIPSELKLVIAGGGDFADLGRNAALKRNDILDIAHLDEKDKHRLMRYANLFCQPSVNESFSIVIMESWLLGTAVIVPSNCAVTRYHVEKSSGGLYYSDAFEFAEIVKTIVNDKNIIRQMVQNGREYVLTQYNWPAVLERFDSVVDSILGIKNEHCLSQR